MSISYTEGEEVICLTSEDGWKEAIIIGRDRFEHGGVYDDNWVVMFNSSDGEEKYERVYALDIKVRIDGESDTSVVALGDFTTEQLVEELARRVKE